MAPRNVVVAQSGGPTCVINNSLRGIVETCRRHPETFDKVFGGRFGIEGVLKEELIDLSATSEEEIALLRTSPAAGGIGTCRYKLKEGQDEDFERVVEVFKAHNVGYFFYIGGNDSQDTAHKVSVMASDKGLDLVAVGVPKTIDNDLAATQVTFGFHTAVQTATDAIDKLHSTAESHERVMVVEVMGRDTGWIALHSGVSGTADVILIPEIPYDFEKVAEKIRERYATGRRFAIVVAAEGAVEKTHGVVLAEQATPGHAQRYGGIAEQLARQIAERTGVETRSIVLGHLQRGGSPTAYDRLIALRFGAAAVRCVAQRQFGRMVALQPPGVRAVPLAEATRELKRVPVESDTVRTARDLGISFGD